MTARRTYFVIVYKDPGYGVVIPDLPGCFSAADDLDSLDAMIREAVELWSEDQEMPPPRSREEIEKLVEDGGWVRAIEL